MKTFPKTKDKIYLVGSLIAFIGFFSLLYYIDTKGDEQKTEWQQAQKSLCLGKENRARPACWREIDWEVFCERVQCKGEPRH